MSKNQAPENAETTKVEAQYGIQPEVAPNSEPETPAAKSALAAAEDHLAQTDDDVTQLWIAKGPKSGRIDQIAGYLHKGAIVVVLAYKSGKFKVFAEEKAEA